MSGTLLPTTHSYSWGTTPWGETSGNGGYLNGARTTTVKLNLLDNFAHRNTNYPIQKGGGKISNTSGYNSGQVSGYTGSMCPMRALITNENFFKYILDNNLEDATGISSDQTFTSNFI